MDIKAALSQLDKNNDDHWTTNGLPRLDVLKDLTGDKSVTRKMVTDADPSFTRETMPGTAGTPEAEVAVEVDSPPDQDADISEEPAETSSGKYVLEMDTQEVFSSEQNMLAFQSEAATVCTELQREKAALEVKITRLSKATAMVTTQLQRLNNARPNSDTQVIRDYLAQQAKVREERAERVRKFIEQGVDQGMLSLAISGKSKIDAALNQRKAAPGSTRPAPRIPVRR